jgi:hypothetical protein
MGGGRITPMISDLLSSASPQETATRSPNPTADAVPRHVLPSDLPSAIKHLSDQELDQLQAAVTAEQQRRGRKPPAPEKTVSKRTEAPAVTLSIGKLNAVRAAFKAGVTPAKIAKQFGIPQAEVRKVIASEP